MNIVTPESVGFSSERLKRIDRHMQREIDKGHTVGISTLLMRRGEVFHNAFFGWQDREAERPINMETIFRIYSMTKPITSVAAMMLYEEGLLLLEDPVADFLPEFADTKVFAGPDHIGMKLVEQERPMMIRDLFTHTAGLGYGFYQDTPIEDLYREADLHAAPDLAEMVRRIASLPLLYQPGTQWRYSMATDVLGRVIEVVSGQSLDEFFRERIFAPLGMTETGFWVPEESLDRFAAIYQIEKGGPLTPVDLPMTNHFKRARSLFSGGGGLISTLPDYLRFAQMLLNRGELDGVRLIGPKTLALMTLNHVDERLFPLAIGGNPMPGSGFGLGFSMVLDTAQYGVPMPLGCYEWSGMAKTTFWVDPVEETVGIFMTQLLIDRYYPIHQHFKALTYQALVE